MSNAREIMEAMFGRKRRREEIDAEEAARRHVPTAEDIARFDRAAAAFRAVLTEPRPEGDTEEAEEARLELNAAQAAVATVLADVAQSGGRVPPVVNIMLCSASKGEGDEPEVRVCDVALRAKRLATTTPEALVEACEEAFAAVQAKYARGVVSEEDLEELVMQVRDVLDDGEDAVTTTIVPARHVAAMRREASVLHPAKPLPFAAPTTWVFNVQPKRVSWVVYHMAM